MTDIAGDSAWDHLRPEDLTAPLGERDTNAPGVPRRAVIVVGVDGSETAGHAGAYAAGMARRLNGLLVCVYVHTIGGLSAAAPSVIPALQEAQQDVVASIKQTIADAQKIPFEQLDIEFVERNGNPFKEIVSVATERRADAVVVGASMQAGHRLVGSLAVHLVRAAQWPVTVVP
ncbi:universal stress protein [Jatrophihabitans sp. YIM 134969]